MARDTQGDKFKVWSIEWQTRSSSLKISSGGRQPYQIEGAWNKHGKGRSTWDRFAHTPGTIKNGDTRRRGGRSLQPRKKDIGLMKKIGLQAYRFSISWPASCRRDGKVNQKGLDFYSKLVDGLLEAGIKPFATLYHWDLPQALEDEGGWAVRSTAEAFVDYTHVVSHALGDRVKNWITLRRGRLPSGLGWAYGTGTPRDLQDLRSGTTGGPSCCC
ncbi:MAG: family 1 glycosylhydrolase [Candidatus Moduliflexus flocculans]|nr:family 1 glycosylhydrolase [Candidatus Moduliflexus flocculans]